MLVTRCMDTRLRTTIIVVRSCSAVIVDRWRRVLYVSFVASLQPVRGIAAADVRAGATRGESTKLLKLTHAEAPRRLHVGSTWAANALGASARTPY